MLGTAEIQTAGEFSLPGECVQPSSPTPSKRRRANAVALSLVGTGCQSNFTRREISRKEIVFTRSTRGTHRTRIPTVTRTRDGDHRYLSLPPESPAYPSLTDVELAFWPDAIYLICSLADRERPDVRGFRIRDGVVTRLHLPSRC
jgi:hypothetical protein